MPETRTIGHWIERALEAVGRANQRDARARTNTKFLG
jgi:hypothetical protein